MFEVHTARDTVSKRCGKVAIRKSNAAGAKGEGSGKPVRPLVFPVGNGAAAFKARYVRRKAGLLKLKDINVCVPFLALSRVKVQRKCR